MPGHTGREQLKIFPIRSRLAGFEQEEQAIQHLAAVLGEPVLRAPTPSMADGLLLCSGGVEEECVNLLRGGASRVMLAGPDHNAYAAGAEVAAWGQREGVPLRLQPLGQRNGVQVRYWLVAQRARNRLKEAVIGLLGGSASWLVASVPQEELLGERFGTGLTHLGWTELLEGIGDDFPFRKAAHADRWTALPRAETVVTQDMRRSLGFSAALEQLVRKRAFSAVALDCFQLVTRLHLTGCLALADLNEAGIPAACEGDVVTALAMLIARETTEQRSWMGNLTFAEEATIWLAHCMAPPSMASGSRLCPHFETGRGVAHAATLPADQQVTLLRLDDELRHAVLVRGRTRELVASPHRCRTQACIDLDAPLPTILGNHHVLLFGDHLQEIRPLLELSGIDVLS